MEKKKLCPSEIKSSRQNKLILLHMQTAFSSMWPLGLHLTTSLISGDGVGVEVGEGAGGRPRDPVNTSGEQLDDPTTVSVETPIQANQIPPLRSWDFKQEELAL